MQTKTLTEEYLHALLCRAGKLLCAALLVNVGLHLHGVAHKEKGARGGSCPYTPDAKEASEAAMGGINQDLSKLCTKCFSS